MRPITDVLEEIASAFTDQRVEFGKIDVAILVKSIPGVDAELYQLFYELGQEFIVPIAWGGFAVFDVSEEKWVYVARKGWSVVD